MDMTDMISMRNDGNHFFLFFIYIFFFHEKMKKTCEKYIASIAPSSKFRTGSVVTWGHPKYGADCDVVEHLRQGPRAKNGQQWWKNWEMMGI